MHSVLNSTQVYTQPKLTVKINGSSGLLFEYSHRRGSYPLSHVSCNYLRVTTFKLVLGYDW